MANEDLDVAGLRSLSHALERTPNGNDVVTLATKLGLWSPSSHAGDIIRPSFPRKVSDLGPEELSDLLAQWTSEYGRIQELLGLLNGQKEQLKIRGKSLRASARGRIRKAHPTDEKPLSSTALNDLAEEDAGVLDTDERLTLVEVLLSSTGAAREATAQYIASISREIAYRDAQMKARMY